VALCCRFYERENSKYHPLEVDTIHMAIK